MRKTDEPSEHVSDVLAEIASQADMAGELKSSRVVQALERQILSGRLAPGARLPTEGELCEILGVSRSVVRDSIRTLAARGLVTVRQGSGMMVAEPGGAAFTNSMLILLTRSGLSMAQVLQARATIETAVAPLAAACGTEEEWAGLDAALKAFERAVDGGDDEVAASAHTRFHTGLLDAAHQPALSLMLKPITEITTVTTVASVRRNSPEDWDVRSHRPILRALRSRDRDAVVRSVGAHYAPYEISNRPTPNQRFLSRRFGDAYFDAAGGNSWQRPRRDRVRALTRTGVVASG